MRSELYQVMVIGSGSGKGVALGLAGAPAMHLTGAEVLAPLEQPFHDCLDPRHLRSRGLGPWRA